MIITDPNKVPICRCCSIGHWTDEVDVNGFCTKHIRSKCKPLRKEGYYWITDNDHSDPIIAYYGEEDGIDQIDRSKRVIWEYGWSLDYASEDYGDAGDEDSVIVISSIPFPHIKNMVRRVYEYLFI